MGKLTRRCTATILTAGCALLCAAMPTARADDAERLFAVKVLPLLKSKCFACHGDDAKKIRGHLDLRARAALLTGGDSGPAIVPGNPEKSLLYKAIKWDGLEMPPKKNDRLTDADVKLVYQWLAAMAPWPNEQAIAKYQKAAWDAETKDGVRVATSGGLSAEWTNRKYKPENVWALRPLTRPAPPARKSTSPVDAFLEAKLAAAGLTPAPLADPVTLIRRASFDVIGLPPTPDEIRRFRKEWDANPETAWGKLIDRLLTSPRYGERWAQHWLDVARYADTGGYSNDFERSNAWRYRDYVIRALNDDKPYDRFVLEQLAGDELADASVRKRMGGDEAKVRRARFDGTYTEEESEWIVATGFLRMGPWDNAMVKDAEARQIYLDDVVNSVGQTFLSTTMRCFKCHDHKFDPLPTRDYYRVYAAFASTQMAERAVPFLKTENRAGFADGEALVKKMLAFAVAEKNKLSAKREAAAKKWYAARGEPYLNKGQRADKPDEQKPPRNVGLDHVDEGRLKVREQDEWIWTRRLERYRPMAQSVYNASDVRLAWNAARKLRINPAAKTGRPPATTILLGGTLAAPGPKVGPGVLSATGLAVAGAPQSDPYVLPEAVEGRRLALAKWIVDPRNPLTSRSIVNRIWQGHFGRGLAANPNNFGTTGGKPSHPELLDWLASSFVESGWRLKGLHRLILTSQAYRRAGTHPQMANLRAKDPDNRLLAYRSPRHLSAEELRDAMLAVTGELTTAYGGLPAMPEINLEVALQPRMIQFSLAPAYQPSPKPAERNRRTVYAYRVRGMADPFLELFHKPNPNDSCEFRDSAPVTPQAFTLLNSDLVADRSIAFAQRLEKQADTVERRIDRAIELAFGRQPTPAELRRLTKYVADVTAYHKRVEPQPVAYPKKVTRTLVEEFSGKPFDYVEILPAFESYQPDVKAGDVPPATRALADLCLLLFNANEFVFVY